MTATTITLDVTLVEAELPAGVVFDSYRFSITDSNGTEVFSQSTKNASVSLPILAPGSYVARVENHTADGVTIGSPVTASFTVDAPAPVEPQTYQSASGLTAVVS